MNFGNFENLVNYAIGREMRREEVSSIVKELDEDCERIFLNDYETFAKGEYENLDLGE